ncbi:MAG: ATP-dependent helicase [Desulfobacterales bacterium]|nr:ATP-dependent helicase [Desulfobacterales bacterium]
MTAVDRLVPLCGEFQRIALSATIKPMDEVGEYIGGYRAEGGPIEPVYRKRKVKIISSEKEKKLSVRVCFPEDANEKLEDNSWWPVLTDAFKGIIQNNRSTLLFANSRRITEKVTRLINEKSPELLAYSHHGALSKEIRLAVEQKLKNGELKAIVSTNSLELGIDIGDLDQVVLVQSPFSVSSAIQRIGRSGHSVGQTSQGRLFPTHGRDFINAAVLVKCILEKDIETIKPIYGPLDVLAQVILAMTGVETWDIDELFYFFKTCSAYHHLNRNQFDRVLEMLAGRHADSRIRELKPRIWVDHVDNTVKARPGTLMFVYMAGGTIPDRGYYNLRLQDNKAKIGELDEEFVWERNIGDTFSLGTQTWRIQRITHNDIEVLPVGTSPGILPFWKAEARNRDFHLSQKIGTFLEQANIMVEKEGDGFLKDLRQSYCMDESAANQLISFLKLQKEITQKDLPHRHHLLIEHFDDPLNKADSKQVILHTLWGGRINRPLAMAMAAAWEKKYNYSLEVFADDDCILLMLPHAFDIGDLIGLVNAGDVEEQLRSRLEKTGLFGAKFRENAGRALLLPRAGFKKRMPLWLNRLRSKKLLDATINIKGFPVLLETWRTCLKDEFDLENLKLILDEIAEGHIIISQTRTTSASPFAGNLIYQQINKYMYEDDTPDSGRTSGITRGMIKEIAGTEGADHRIPINLIDLLQQKLQRIAPFYAPRSSDELLDWVKERILIPMCEWQDLLLAINREYDIDSPTILGPIERKIVNITLPNTTTSSVCAIESLPRLLNAFDQSLSLDRLHMTFVLADGETSVEEIAAAAEKMLQNFPDDKVLNDAETIHMDFLGQWLSYYGPVNQTILGDIFGFNRTFIDDIIGTLKDADIIVQGIFREEGEDIEILYQDNFEILLRMARKARQPEFTAIPLDCLPLFQAHFQGIIEPGRSIEDLKDRLDQLFGFIAPAQAWEEYILPARLNPYFTSWLDSLMQSSELSWFGNGMKKTGFAFSQDLEFFVVPEKTVSIKDQDKDGDNLLPDNHGRYSFFDITQHSGLGSENASKKLWDNVWQGKLTNDTFAVLRMGILNKFKPEKPSIKSRGRRGQFNRWKSSRPLLGNWYHLELDDTEPDIMAQTEILKERVRQVLGRYGILFREILMKEQPLLSWASLFKTLRLMELSGEILSGHFFEDIPGLQFISHEAFRMLQKPLPEDSIYWMNAADPASLCGIQLDGLKSLLPPRLSTTHLVFHGRKLVMVSRKSGKQIHIHVPSDHPHLFLYFSFFKVIANREFNPSRSILIETINDESAAKSQYGEKLIEFGFSKDYKGLELRRDIGIM